MARVFTISFDFWGERQIAMVTMSEQKISGIPICHIKLFNQDLYAIIPEGKLSFILGDHRIPTQIQNQVAEELYLSLRQSLTNYLPHNTPTASR